MSFGREQHRLQYGSGQIRTDSLKCDSLIGVALELITNERIDDSASSPPVS